LFRREMGWKKYITNYEFRSGGFIPPLCIGDISVPPKKKEKIPALVGWGIVFDGSD
jgi:hypothetical protein